MFGQSLLSAFGSAACTTDTDQLFTTDVQTTSLATYQLNNATTSIPSNTYPGTPSNITYAAGKFGNAAVFNGSSSKITSSLGLTGNPVFSFSFWINPSGINGTPIMLGTNSTNQAFLTFLTASNQLNFGRWGDSLGTTTATLPNNTWTNVAISNNAGSVQVYINGAADLSFSTTYNITGNNFYIGAANNTQYFNGSIDQVRIFSTALPQSAVTALYNETTTTATYPYITSEVANPNSIAYYKMSDATDQLGNYNGTATNVNFNTEGKFGFAGAFNGSSSKVVLPDAVSSSIATASAFTISMWFNISGGSGRRFLYFFGRSTYIYLEVESDNTLRAVVNASGGSVAIDDSTVLSNNVWYNAILTGSNAANLTLYLNGSSVGTASWDGTFGAASGVAVNIGNENNALYFNGSIDQVRIYNAAVSAANVTTLYNEIECPAVAVTNAFNTVIYTGNGSTQSITSLDFQPDLVWTKQRSSPNRDHQSNDSVRGANKILYPNLSVAEDTAGGVGSAYFNSFDSNGFTVGSSPYYNGSGLNYVTWNWKAGGTAVSNTDGAITSQVSANVDAGFSIVEWSSSGGVGTVGHGLNEVPQLIIIKKTASSSPWSVYAAPVGNDKRLQLNESAAAATDSIWNNTTPTNKVFTEQISGGATTDNIAYCFHSVAGYSKVGSYTGTGATLQTLYIGFEPSFILIKNTNSGNVWTIMDNKRNTTNPRNLGLFPNLSNLEYTYPGTPNGLYFTSTGFTLNTTQAEYNENTYSYIFLAIA